MFMRYLGGGIGHKGLRRIVKISQTIKELMKFGYKPPPSSCPATAPKESQGASGEGTQIMLIFEVELIMCLNCCAAHGTNDSETLLIPEYTSEEWNEDMEGEDSDMHTLPEDDQDFISFQPAPDIPDLPDAGEETDDETEDAILEEAEDLFYFDESLEGDAEDLVGESDVDSDEEDGD